MNTEIIEKIKKFVEEECKKPSSNYGYEAFIHHFVPMVKYAEQLADELGGDKEVIILAAWLHDIGSIIYGRENHHITSAKIAEEKLRELGYPEEKIEKVKKCILNHRGSLQRETESIEEQIIVEADTLSNFDNIAGIFAAAYLHENKNQSEAKKAVITKLKNKWKQLRFEKSKKIIEPKYKAALLLFSNS